MAAIHNVGGPCPVCKEAGHKGDFRALAPLVVKDKVMERHSYAVGLDCYKGQWFDVYGEALGKSYDEYLADKAAHLDDRGVRF